MVNGGERQRLQVQKYLPMRMYGFLASGTSPQYFFHLRVFRPGTPLATSEACRSCQHDPCAWLKVPPPPIIGETVEATLETDPEHPENFRASRVDRIIQPIPLAGTVDTFDAPRGYGFLRGSDGRTYYLHRSEVVEGRIPLVGQAVRFFVAEQRDKARACHIKICS